MNAHSRAGNLQTTRLIDHNGHAHTVAPLFPTTLALLPPPSTGLGRGVATPFARRRPNRECALTRWEPADNKILIPQRPRAHGRGPPSLLPPPCFHPPASPEGALAVASCALHVHQPPQPSTVDPDSCYSPMLLSFAAYTLRCRSNGGGRP